MEMDSRVTSASHNIIIPPTSIGVAFSDHSLCLTCTSSLMENLSSAANDWGNDMNMLPLCMRARVSAWQQGAGCSVRWILGALTDTLTAVSLSLSSERSQTDKGQTKEGRKEGVGNETRGGFHPEIEMETAQYPSILPSFHASISSPSLGV